MTGSPTRARILLIDDDEVDFVITRKLLAKLGARNYDLEWADSYEAGLVALDRQEHDEAARVISQAMNFSMVLIERHHPERAALENLGCAGFEHGSGHLVSVDQSPAEEVVRGGIARIEMPLQGHLASHGSALQTVLCLPIGQEEQPPGALTLAHPEALPVDSTQASLAAAVAAHLGGLLGRGQATEDTAP